MGVHILVDRKSEQAVLYCSTTDWAFGPVFPSESQAYNFLTWLSTDPRSLTDTQLEHKYTTWQIVTKFCAFCNEPFQPAEATNADQLCEECYERQNEARRVME